MDREARRAAVHGVTKSQTWLIDWTELNWSILCRVYYDSTELLREKGDLLPGCKLPLGGSLHRMSPVLHVFDEPLLWYSTPAAQAIFPAFYCYNASGFSSMELLHYELRQLLQCPALAVHDSRQSSASISFPWHVSWKFLIVEWLWEDVLVCVLSLFSRIQPCNSIKCSPPGSFIHGIL